jgi:uncharacterized membrane protein YcaP (DUF421 family)
MVVPEAICRTTLQERFGAVVTVTRILSFTETFTLDCVTAIVIGSIALATLEEPKSNIMVTEIIFAL